MSAPDERIADADPRAWVQDAVSTAMNDEAAAEEQENAEQLEKLRAEMEKLYTEALQIYKARFTELPSMQRLRERWKARQIADDDPILMNMEVHAIADARSQIVLTQIMNIIQAFEQMTRIHARQVRLGITEIAESRKETAVFAEKLAKGRAEQDALSKSIAQYGRELPELLETMAAVRKLCDTASLRAKAELAGLGAGLVFVGILIGKYVL